MGSTAKTTTTTRSKYEMEDWQYNVVFVCCSVTIMVLVICAIMIRHFRKRQGPMWGDEHLPMSVGEKRDFDEEDETFQSASGTSAATTPKMGGKVSFKTIRRGQFGRTTSVDVDAERGKATVETAAGSSLDEKTASGSKRSGYLAPEWPASPKTETALIGSKKQVDVAQVPLLKPKGETGRKTAAKIPGNGKKTASIKKAPPVLQAKQPQRLKK